MPDLPSRAKREIVFILFVNRYLVICDMMCRIVSVLYLVSNCLKGFNKELSKNNLNV